MVLILYSLRSTMALLAGTTFTDAVTTTGLSLGDNSLNFKIGTAAYSLTTNMLTALMDKSTLWQTSSTIGTLTSPISFSTSKPLGADVSSARLILWSGTLVSIVFCFRLQCTCCIYS